MPEGIHIGAERNGSARLLRVLVGLNFDSQPALPHLISFPPLHLPH